MKHHYKDHKNFFLIKIVRKELHAEEVAGVLLVTVV